MGPARAAPFSLEKENPTWCSLARVIHPAAVACGVRPLASTAPSPRSSPSRSAPLIRGQRFEASLTDADRNGVVAAVTTPEKTSDRYPFVRSEDHASPGSLLQYLLPSQCHMKRVGYIKDSPIYAVFLIFLGIEHCQFSTCRTARHAPVHQLRVGVWQQSRFTLNVHNHILFYPVICDF